MSVVEQTTLAKPVAAGGVALHSGRNTRIILRPAAADQGVLFRRIDLLDEGLLRDGAEDYDRISIKARPSAVSETRLGTTLINTSGIAIATVEHVMAALAICGVDNVIIDIVGSEVPIFDGSAAPFVQLLRQAGLMTLDAPRRAVKIRTPKIVEDGDRFIAMEPTDDFDLEVTVDFDDSAIGRQTVSLNLDDRTCVDRLARARTFCLFRDVEAMRSAGFGRGGSLDNSLVVDNGRILNDDGLRDPQEFALHKALDLLGDLYLLGAPVIGRVRAHKPGHDLNICVARLLEVDPELAERTPASAILENERQFA
ncbi:MAG: UDP-3-O-acyl-N-acetylglucosamine deacetylase [Parvularculaceae bacterium]